MAKPPAGYSIQRGAYFTDDGQGPYSWDGSVMTLLGGGGGGGAGGYIGQGDEAAMLATAAGTTGRYFIRTDTVPLGVWFLLDGSDPSDINNWLEPTTDAGFTWPLAFSGAGDWLLAAGPLRVHSIFLSTSVVGDVAIKDGTTFSGPDTLPTTVTAVGVNISIPVNGAVNTGVCLRVNGANAGFVIVGEA
jgi:hypothetical protein